jgi:hypothetical protein
VSVGQTKAPGSDALRGLKSLGAVRPRYILPCQAANVNGVTTLVSLDAPLVPIVRMAGVGQSERRE